MGKVWHKVWRQGGRLLGSTGSWRRRGLAWTVAFLAETNFESGPSSTDFYISPTTPHARERCTHGYGMCPVASLALDRAS